MKSFKPEDKISKFFTYKEVLWLPSYNRMAKESDGLSDEVLARLEYLCKKMDLVREYFDKSIKVHVCYRPEKYNKLIGGAKNSAHRAEVDRAGNKLADNVMEAAMDFSISGLDCDDARKKIMDDKKLEEWGMRMEDLPNSNWIHLDTREPLPGSPRFFKP